jgi:hypothetical protein
MLPLPLQPAWHSGTLYFIRNISPISRLCSASCRLSSGKNSEVETVNANNECNIKNSDSHGDESENVFYGLLCLVVS